ncbi:rtf2 [[Candida] subhashii]|uniref:Rtf2 n=1 Tax=[Candida] subhashii TaxID=561895 RepID=A0A8J5UED3_9ASCO|nr:rtf2 [[Candida] subhashii]KAG7661053.1 rtf2 [[Candida] subhashii]
MGADGGTIAKRQDILSLHSNSVSSFKQKGDDNEETLLKSCAISSLPLYTKSNDPIVGDYKGRLYLKEKIIEYLLESKTDKSKIRPSFKYVKSLKDLCPVYIKWTETAQGEHNIECPITKESKTTKVEYVYLRPCGCVMSHKGLKELNKHIKMDSGPVESRCPTCSKKFHFDYDVVIINPLNKEDIDLYNEKNYRYLRNELRLSHSSIPLKKDNKANGVGTSSKKRKQDQKPVNDLEKKQKTNPILALK